MSQPAATGTYKEFLGHSYLQYSTSSDARTARAREDADAARAQRNVAEAFVQADNPVGSSGRRPIAPVGPPSGATRGMRPASAATASPGRERLRTLELMYEELKGRMHEQMKQLVVEQRKVTKLRTEKLKLRAENNYLRLQLNGSARADQGDDPALSSSLPTTSAETARAAISAAANEPLLSDDGEVEGLGPHGPYQRSHRPPPSAPLRRAEACSSAAADAATFHAKAAKERAGREGAEAQLLAAEKSNRTLEEALATARDQITKLQRQVAEQIPRAMPTAGSADTASGAVGGGAVGVGTVGVGAVGVDRLAWAPPAPEPLASGQVARADLVDALLKEAVEAAEKAAAVAAKAQGAERGFTAGAPSASGSGRRPSTDEVGSGGCCPPKPPGKMPETWRANTWCTTQEVHSMIAKLLTAPLAPLVEKLSAELTKPVGGADEASKKRTLAAAELAFLRHLGGKQALTPEDEKDMEADEKDAAGAVYEIVRRVPKGEQLWYECKKKRGSVAVNVPVNVVQIPDVVQIELSELEKMKPYVMKLIKNFEHPLALPAVLDKLLAKTPERLAETLANGLSKLHEGYTSSELSEKFMMAKMSEFHLCDIKAFYDGLEVAVGMPNPDLFESMRREHTKRSDSDIWFTTSNYLCHTSSCIEWYFVVDPARGKEVLKRKSYPSEATALERRKRRNERELDTFDVAISDVNNRLRLQAQRPLRKEEFIASRLYTGPMFQKYNAVLRANAGESPQWMKDTFQTLCKGNRYTTTIWVLNSAIVKLKVLTPAARVYRGLKGLALPEAFRTKDKHGIKGGVEPGFMSTTLDYKVAMTYAGASETTKDASGIVFEIHQGLVDRGCDLSWLSQYPFEREILFAPLTGVEVLDTRVDGSVLVVVLRPTTNQKAATIDDVVSRLQNSHVQFVDLLMEQFTRADAPSEALMPLKTLKSSALKREPKWFNEAENYLDATDKALSAKEEVFTLLGKVAKNEAEEVSSTKMSTASPTAVEPTAVAAADSAASTSFGGAETLRDKAAKYFNAAKLCAASKKINLAIVLLHLSLQLCNQEEGSRLHPMLTTDDYEDIEYILEAENESSPATLTRSKSELRPPAPRSQPPRALSKTVSAIELRGDYEYNKSSYDVAKVRPRDRLILLKMLLKEPNEIGAWASTIVGLLTHEAKQADLVLRCFVQFLEKHKLIEDKPIKIGSTLLALVAGEHKDDNDYHRGVLLANIHKVPNDESQSGAQHDVRHVGAKVVHHVKLPNGKTIRTTLVLPFGNNDAGAVLRAAAAQDNVAVLTALLDKGLSPLHADEHANTALHVAAENGCEKACTTLLTHPAMQPLAHLQPAFMSNIHGVRPYDWSLMGKRAKPRLRTLMKKSVWDNLIDQFSADSTSEPKLLQLIHDPSNGDAKLSGLLLGAVDTTGDGKVDMLVPLKRTSSVGADMGGEEDVFVSFEAYCAHERKTEPGLTDEVLRKRFVTIDLNRSGTLSKRELEQVVTNVDANAPGKLGITPLMLAAFRGFSHTVLRLLEKHADPLLMTEEGGCTALTIAVLEGHKAVVENLLDVKNHLDPAAEKYGEADEKQLEKHALNIVEKMVEHTEKDGTSALLRACQNGFHDAAHLLIEKKSNVNIQRTDKLQRTPLIMAARAGSVKCVKMLLENMANPFQRDAEGSTALTQAAYFGHSEVVEVLAKGTVGADGCGAAEAGGETRVSPDEASYVNREENLAKQTALILAARRGHLQTVQALLRREADVHPKDKNGLTALMWACKRGHDSIIPLLIARGERNEQDGMPQRLATDKKGMTALMHAAHNGHVQAAEILVVEGWDLLDRNNHGMTALMLAARSGVKEMVHLLSTCETFGSHQNQTRHPAQGSLIMDTTRLLAALADGTDNAWAYDSLQLTMLAPNDSTGYAPTFVVTTNQKKEIVNIVMTNPGKGYVSTDTPTLTWKSGTNTITTLGAAAGGAFQTSGTLGGTQATGLKFTINPGAGMASNAATPSTLMGGKAVSSETQNAPPSRPIVKEEVLNATDYTGKTALMYAAECLHASTIRELLHAGCDRTKIDQNGLTAHMMARSAKSTSREVKIGALREFHGQFGDSKEGNPPLCALRGKVESELDADDLVGVGAFVLDVGTGACKIMIWVRFDTVSLIEAKDAEIKKLPSGKAFDFKKIFEGGLGDKDPMFEELVATLHNAMDTAFKKHKQLKHCLFTNVCIGLTAWYRQLSDELKEKGRPVMDALRDKLRAKAQELSHSRSIESKWFVVSQKEEAMWEHKSVEYALQASGLEPPLALLSGGQGSVQLSGLDGFTSYDLQLKDKIKSIDMDVENDPMKDPKKREAGLKAWGEEIKKVVSSKDDKLASQLRKIALESQGESSEPVRIVLISGLFYVAIAAKIVQPSTDHYAYQPASVVLEMFDQLRKKVNDAKTETQDLVGAVRVSELLRSLIDGAYVQRVELLFARDWVLHGVGKLHDKTLMFPEGQTFNFRTTWTAGWWLDQLAELYRKDTELDLHEAGLE